jgi:hypothetical protein
MVRLNYCGFGRCGPKIVSVLVCSIVAIHNPQRALNVKPRRTQSAGGGGGGGAATSISKTDPSASEISAVAKTAIPQGWRVGRFGVLATSDRDILGPKILEGPLAAWINTTPANIAV